MALSQSITKRLMLARYLFSQADDAASSNREVAAFAAINMLQDAIEIFFLAAADNLNAEIGRRTEFEQYIDKINERLPEPLPFRQRLIEINKVRVLSKHNGVAPNAAELTGYFADARQFLEDGCQRIFDASFWAISLVELLPQGETRNFVAEAEKYYQSQNYSKCLIECRKAIYVEIEHNYVIDAFGHGEGGLFAEALCKSPSHTKNKRYIDENVRDPFDFIQLDHDRVDAELLRDGIAPAVFWNIWRLTPAVYRKTELFSNMFMVKQDLERYDETTAERSAAYVLEHTIDILLKKAKARSSFRRMKADVRYVAKPKDRKSFKVYRKADKRSEVLGEVPGTTEGVSLKYWTPGLWDGFFWRIDYDAEDEDLVFSGYADDNDLDLG